MLLDGCGHGRVDQTAPPVYFRGNFHYAVIDRRKIVQNTAQFPISCLIKGLISNCKCSKNFMWEKLLLWQDVRYRTKLKVEDSKKVNTVAAPKEDEEARP